MLNPPNPISLVGGRALAGLDAADNHITEVKDLGECGGQTRPLYHIVLYNTGHRIKSLCTLFYLLFLMEPAVLTPLCSYYSKEKPRLLILCFTRYTFFHIPFVLCAVLLSFDPGQTLRVELENRQLEPVSKDRGRCCSSETSQKKQHRKYFRTIYFCKLSLLDSGSVFLFCSFNYSFTTLHKL